MSRYLNYYIADGFAEDCEALIEKFLKTESSSYHVFCNIWKDMKFADVFKGRTTRAEVAELSEEYLIIAKQFMVAPSNNFEEATAGLFLLYGVAHTQPFEKFAAVRFIPEDVDCIMRIKEEATNKKRWDVLYILGSLLIEGPSEFHIAQRPYGMDRPVRKYFEDKMGVINEVYHRGVMHKHSEETEALRGLSLAMRRYTASKNSLPPELASKVHNYIDNTLPEELERSLKILVGEEVPTEETPQDQDHHETRSRIRDRAMKETCGKLKYLQTVGESSQHKPESKEEMVEDKRKSPKKNTPKKSPNTVKSPRRCGRKRNLSKSDNQEPKTVSKAKKVSNKPTKGIRSSIDKNNEDLLGRSADNVELDLDKFIVED